MSALYTKHTHACRPLYLHFVYQPKRHTIKGQGLDPKCPPLCPGQVYQSFAVELRCHATALILAHLCRRLNAELIGYPWIRRRPSVVCPFTFSNIFSSKTAWPIKAKFFVEPPWDGGTKAYINGPGHMTKMATTPIYGKIPSKIFFSRTGGPIFTKLDM